VSAARFAAGDRVTLGHGLGLRTATVRHHGLCGHGGCRHGVQCVEVWEDGPKTFTTTNHHADSLRPEGDYSLGSET
jgi:hypothetical protein